MVFHPDLQLKLLIVSYTGDGSLAVFNMSTMTRLCTFPAVFALTLACSPDGKFLIAGTKVGIKHTMELYEMGRDGDSVSLNLVYSVSYPARTITALAASDSGLRFASIHVMDCEIWQPSILSDDNRHQGDSTTYSDNSNLSMPLIKSTEMLPKTPRGEITSFCLSADGKTALCGSEEGKVWAFATSDGSEIGMIFQTHSQSQINMIMSIERGDDEVIILADFSKCWSLLEAKHSSTNWSMASLLIEGETTGTTEHFLLSPTKENMLIVTMSTTSLFELPSGKLLQKKMIPKWNSKLRAASNCPSDDGLFMILEHTTLHVFYWANFEPAHTLHVKRDGDFIPSSLSTSTVQHQSQRFLVEMLSDSVILPNVTILSDHEGDYQFNCWDASHFGPSENNNVLKPQHDLHRLTSLLRVVICLSGSMLIFLDKDLWVCSVDLATFASTSLAKRYFFILPQWTDANGRVGAALTPELDLLFVNKQGVVVIKRWMTFSQTVTLASGAKSWEVVSRRMNDATLANTLQEASLEKIRRESHVLK